MDDLSLLSNRVSKVETWQEGHEEQCKERLKNIHARINDVDDAVHENRKTAGKMLWAIIGITGALGGLNLAASIGAIGG